MNILMAASEMAPLARTGALSEAVADLSGELRKLGHDVSVVMPYYRSIRENKAIKPRKSGIKFSVPVGTGNFPCEVFEVKMESGVKVYLVSRDEFFDRTGVYGVDGRDYQDNSARFIYFTKCAVELGRQLDPAPDIFHAHSWETALAPVFVRDQRLPFHTVLTPHTLAYQGNFWSYDFGLTNLPGEYFSSRGVEFYGSMNCLKGGLLFADAVVLPSERFIAEAQKTSEYGCGLESVLREQQHKLQGIPFAPDWETWNPATDTEIAAKFSAAKPVTRLKNRTALLSALNLQTDPRAVFCTFLDAGTGPGLEALFGGLDRLLAENVRVILLGAIPGTHTLEIEIARRKHAGQLAYLPDFDEKTARLALAGSDVFFVPNSTEPLPLWLPRALRYGAVPLVAQSGGLFQFVRDWEPARNVGNGFVFHARTADGVVDAARCAINALSDPEQQKALLARALEADFSKTATAREYVRLYERLLGVAEKAA